MLNVGVIGVGYLGQHHARIFSELAGESGDLRLVAVADTDKKKAEEAAGKYGCKAYSDYRDSLVEADVFSIVTPTTTHYKIAMDCIKAGKDVLIEKPIASSVQEADELIKASGNAGVIVQVGHLERFNPVIEALYPLLDKPVFIEAERLSPFLGRGIDVDITVDLMIHDIDIVFSILGMDTPYDLKAAGLRTLTENIDFAKAWLDFGGAAASFTASRIAPEKSRRLSVFQEKSCLVVDYQGLEIKRYYAEGGAILHETFRVEKKEPLKEELKNFIGCVGKRALPKVCASTGRNALKAALKIGERIRQGWLQA